MLYVSDMYLYMYYGCMRTPKETLENKEISKSKENKVTEIEQKDELIKTKDQKELVDDENSDDFEFNQDINFDDPPTRSPGWIRYQKKFH